MPTAIPKTRREELTPPPPKPVVTVIFILTAWFLPFLVSMAKGSKVIWAATYAMSANSFFEALSNSNYAGLASLITLANFAQLSFLTYLLNAFFIWSFGSVVERIMGNIRFFVFVLFAIFGSWTILAYDGISTQPNMLFIGPTTFTFALMGAYLLFLPRKPFKPTDWVRPSWKIFREDKPIPLDERYWVSPWSRIISFIAYIMIVQFALMITKQGLEEVVPVAWVGNVYEFLLGKSEEAVSVARPLASGEIIVFGIVLSAFIMIATSIRRKALRPGGELQWETVQHYRRLRTLDLTHEQALEGAAKFVAVPYEVAKDWVSKGSDEDNNPK